MEEPPPSIGPLPARLHPWESLQGKTNPKLQHLLNLSLEANPHKQDRKLYDDVSK